VENHVNTKTILVTGATGNVGLEVFRGLVAADVPVRAASSNPARAKQKLGLPAEYVAFDFTQPQTFEGALEGVEQMFLMRPPHLANANKTFKPFLQQAKQAGIRQVVFLSLLGVQNNPVVPHRKIEDLILKLGLPYVFLRAGFFMQNLSTTHAEDICQGDIFIPAGQGKTSFIDVRDIAAVAVRALLEGHANQAYDLTGAAALSYADVAQVMTTVLGRPITYSNPSNYRFGKVMHSRGNPLPQVLVMEALYTLTKLGQAGFVSDTFEQVMGRRPTTLEQFVRDHQDIWNPRS
jgi:uncharacterized protein YbjT (DUF2867 family)